MTIDGSPCHNEAEHTDGSSVRGRATTNNDSPCHDNAEHNDGSSVRDRAVTNEGSRYNDEAERNEDGAAHDNAYYDLEEKEKANLTRIPLHRSGG